MPRGLVAIKKREIERVGRALAKLGLPIERLDVEGGKASFVLGEPAAPPDQQIEPASSKTEGRAA